MNEGKGGRKKKRERETRSWLAGKKKELRQTLAIDPKTTKRKCQNCYIWKNQLGHGQGTKWKKKEEEEDEE